MLRIYLNIAKMIVVGNGATQRTLLKARFVIFRCQKYVKKGYIEMTKKIYLQPFLRVCRVAPFPTTKIGDKILVKQWKRNKLTSLYKSQPFTVIEKKGNTVKIRDVYENERVQNVKDVHCFWGGSDSLH